jgi:hypothetical protein
MTGAARSHHERVEEHTRLTSRRINLESSSGATIYPYKQLNSATRPFTHPLLRRIARNTAFHVLPSPHTDHNLMSEKQVYTNAEDIIHWGAMREEQRPHLSLTAQARPNLGQRRNVAAERI